MNLSGAKGEFAGSILKYRFNYNKLFVKNRSGAKLKKLLLVIVLVFLVNCTQRAVVVREEQPQFYKVSGRQYPHNISVVFSQDLLRLEEVIDPFKFGYAVNSRHVINIGKPLSMSLTGGADLIYNKVTVIDNVNKASADDRIIRFSQVTGAFDIEQHGRTLSVTRISYTLNILLELIDHNNNVIKSEPVSGKGVYNAGLSIHDTKDRFSVAINGSIFIVTEIVANLLAKGFAEPGS